MYITTQIPVWINALFILSMLSAVWLMARTAKEAALAAGYEKARANTLFILISVFYGLYFIYTSVLTVSGVFAENTLPPPILLYTAFPLLSFLLCLTFFSKSYRTLLHHASLSSLVRIHVFRLIGVFFLITEAYGVIPSAFAYTAGIGDIATALLAIVTATALDRKKRYARTLTIVWNIFGLLDIVMVLISAILLTQMSMENHTAGVSGIAQFPYCFIPAFAPATILFLHVSVFIKLRMTHSASV